MRINRLKVIFAFGVVLAMALFGASQKKLTSSGEPTLVPFRVGDKWGFSDKSKKIIIAPIYEGVRPFSNGMADVYLTNNKCGYINRSGREIIPVGTYKDCYPFSNGVAFVLSSDGYELIDQSGRTLLQSGAVGYGWSDGLQVISLRNGTGVIDKMGKIVIPPGKYSEIGKFSEGVARVQIGSHNDHTNGFVDRTGKLIFSTRDECADRCEFSEGLLAMYKTVGGSRMQERQIFGHMKTHPSGFINKSGAVVIPFKYQFASNFSEGLALVMENDSWFFIDKSGEKKIALKYEFAFPFCNGLAPVTKNAKWGFIDKTGREIVQLKYDSASGDSSFGTICHEGLYGVAVLKDSNTARGGYIDQRGNEVIPLEYEHAAPFENGLAWVRRYGKEFYIDKNGTEYYVPSLTDIRSKQGAGIITEVGYIDVIETVGSGCRVRVIAGDRSYNGVIGFERLSELTGKRIRTYEDALAALDGTQVTLTMSGVTSSKDSPSIASFGAVSQMSFLTSKAQNDPKQRWNERTTTNETIIDISTDVLFDFNKSTINPQAVPTLIKLARLLRQSNAKNIELNGFTDSIGSNEYNVELSQRRSQAVKQWLVSKGDIDSIRLTTNGYGKEQPVAPNTNADGSDSPAGRQKNRRVEIRIPKS